jgi:hypothetical protein
MPITSIVPTEPRLQKEKGARVNANFYRTRNGCAKQAQTAVGRRVLNVRETPSLALNAFVPEQSSELN